MGRTFLCALLLALWLPEGTWALKVFVSYLYSNKEPDAHRNMKFFLKHGIHSSANIDVDYGLVIKGPCRGEACEEPHKIIQEGKYKNLLVVNYKPGNDYYFDGHLAMLDRLSAEDALTYDHYIFLKCAAIGPMVPAYMPKGWHWASAFIDKMNDSVGLVGASISCLPKGVGAEGPKVEEFAFALSAQAVAVVRNNRQAFRPSRTSADSMDDGYTLTKTVMDQHIGIDCLLLGYRGMDWFNRSIWNCNDNRQLSKDNYLDGISIHPLEVLFYKGKNKQRDAAVWTDTSKYIQWRYMSARRERTRIPVGRSQPWVPG